MGSLRRVAISQQELKVRVKDTPLIFNEYNACFEHTCSRRFRSANLLGCEALNFSYHATPEVARGTATESEK